VDACPGMKAAAETAWKDLELQYERDALR